MRCLLVFLGEGAPWWGMVPEEGHLPRGAAVWACSLILFLPRALPLPASLPLPGLLPEGLRTLASRTLACVPGFLGTPTRADRLPGPQTGDRGLGQRGGRSLTSCVTGVGGGREFGNLTGLAFLGAHSYPPHPTLSCPWTPDLDGS